jgi:hypothetical protein
MVLKDLVVLKTDADFCHQGRDTEIAQNIYDCSNLQTWPFIGKVFWFNQFSQKNLEDLMWFVLLQEEETQVNGVVLVNDLSEVTWKHVKEVIKSGYIKSMLSTVQVRTHKQGWRLYRFPHCDWFQENQAQVAF